MALDLLAASLGLEEKRKFFFEWKIRYHPALQWPFLNVEKSLSEIASVKTANGKKLPNCPVFEDELLKAGIAKTGKVALALVCILTIT